MRNIAAMLEHIPTHLIGGPLGAGKTSLKVFDISGIQCQAIGRMLLNGVMSCKGAKAEPADCLALVSVSSRAAQPFIK